MEIHETIQLVCTLVMVGCAIYVAWRANRHFQRRALFDWLSQFNSDAYIVRDKVVFHLIRENKPEELIEIIEGDTEKFTAVTFVMSFLLEGATSARFRLVDRDLFARYTIFIVPYYYEALKPWIAHRRKTVHSYLYHDLDWLYEYIREHQSRIMKQ